MVDRQSSFDDQNEYKTSFGDCDGSEREDILTYGRDAVPMNTQRIPFSAAVTTTQPVCINQHKIKLENTNKNLAIDHQLSHAFPRHQQDHQENSSSYSCLQNKGLYEYNIQSNPGYCQTDYNKQNKKYKPVLTFVRPSPSRRRASSSPLIHLTISKTRKLANLAKSFKLSISDSRLESSPLFDDFFIYRAGNTTARTFEGARFLFCNTRSRQSPAIQSFVVPKESICLDEDDADKLEPVICNTQQESLQPAQTQYNGDCQQIDNTHTDNVIPSAQQQGTTGIVSFIATTQTHESNDSLPNTLPYNCELQPSCSDTRQIVKDQAMNSPKPAAKCLERQAAVEEDDGIGVVEKGYVTYDDNNTTVYSPHMNRYSYSSVTSQFDVKTDDDNTTSHIDHDSQNNTTADHEQPGQKARKKFNRVKLALATSHAGIFVTGDSIDDPSCDSPKQQSFDTCPSWMGSHEVSTSYLTPHYQPSTSSTEMECTVTCQPQQGPSILLISTTQRSNSSEKDSYHSLSPNSKTSGHSVHDSGFEASGRHSNALSSPSFRKMNISSTDKSTDPQSSDEYLSNHPENISTSMKVSTRRRKIADLQSCRRGRVDLLSPTFRSRSADSNDSSKMLRCYSNSSGDSGLDTPQSAASLSPRSPRQRHRDARRYSNQSKVSSKSSIKSDNSKGSFLSFLSPKHILSRHSSAAEVRSCGSKSSRKRLSDFPDDERLLTINVSGRTFKLHEYFTSAYPESLLGNSKRNKFFDKQKDEFFFDRDPDIFRHIWNFYYTGKLHFPKDECVNLFVDEITFFGISEDYLCTCCWEDEYEPAKEKLDKIRAEIARQKQEQQKSQMKIPMGASFKERVWLTIKYPVISLPARVFYFISILAIFISTVANVTETIPCATSTSICKKHNKQVYFYIDAACVSFFTVEYFIGLASAPNRLLFIRQFMSIVDLLAIVPFYCDLLIRVFSGPAAVSGIDFLEILRILRIVRVFKLLKHSHRLQALIQTFKSSTKELGLIVVIYMVLVTVFSSVIYYAEMQDNPKYSSIPQSMWYAVITTTTTGYGDIVPETILGKLVGCACCLLGVLIVALPVPILQIK